MPTLRCPLLPEATRERRERLSRPLGWLSSEASGRTSAEPEVSGTGRLRSLRELPWRQAPTRRYGHRCHPHPDEDQAAAVKPTHWIYTHGSTWGGRWQ
jgi:hypothetical protein